CITDAEPGHDVGRESAIVAEHDALGGESGAGRDPGARIGRTAIRSDGRTSDVTLVPAGFPADAGSADEGDVEAEVQAEPILFVRTRRACHVIADVTFAGGTHARRAVGVGFAARR